MKYKLIIAFLLTGLVTAGCSTVGGDRKFQAVDSVKLSRDIEMPKGASYKGGASNLSNGGLIGAVIYLNTDRPKDVVLTDYLKEKNILVSEILREQTVLKLKSTVFAEKLNDAGKFEIGIKVIDYGLSKGWGFSGNMKPTIKANMTMVGPNNEVIFSEEGLVGGATGELLGKSIEEWMVDPEGLRAGYVDAANRLVDILLAHYIKR